MHVLIRIHIHTYICLHIWPSKLAKSCPSDQIPALPPLNTIIFQYILSREPRTVINKQTSTCDRNSARRFNANNHLQSPDATFARQSVIKIQTYRHGRTHIHIRDRHMHLQSCSHV